MIDSQDGEPLYLGIAADLRKDILTGRLSPGQKVPSETYLGQLYGVNRLTARAAVNVLRAEGLAELRRGRGVVVREPPERQELTLAVGSAIVARMPTPEERAEHNLETGIPVFSVTDPDGTVQIYPADRWLLRLR